jgi:hypothetical protein
MTYFNTSFLTHDTLKYLFTYLFNAKFSQKYYKNYCKLKKLRIVKKIEY